MAYYKTCPFCGNNLDPGERCECRDVKPVKPKKEYHYISPRIFTKGLTFETQIDGTIVVKAGNRVREDLGLNFENNGN